ncbi:MAG: hypothetical protein ACRCZF_09805 [Gemmataceae bacterium]
MAYSDFDLRTALRAFGLTEQYAHDLFASITPLLPSTMLVDWLDEYTPIAVGMNTEAARSQYIITPVLADARRRAVGPMMTFVGVNFPVDPARGLNGSVDYLIARSSSYLVVRSPLVAVIEAKRDNLIDGLGQCTAAMVAAQRFNEQDNTPQEIIYGCVTSGAAWRFLSLQGTQLQLDEREYSLDRLPQILGILVAMTGTGARASAA